MARPINGLEDGSADDSSWRSSGVQERAQRTPSVPPVAELQLQRPLVSIGAPADLALLEPTYAYLSAYAFACFQPRVAERLNVAIYELYSNALRYGTASGEVRLELARSPGGQGAVLRISNYAEPEQVARLTAQLSRVLTDPSGAFAYEMDRFAGGSQPPPRLGLVRVGHESGLPLKLRSEREFVELSTICEP